jgi:hypothetical protein
MAEGRAMIERRYGEAPISADGSKTAEFPW